MEPVGSPLGSNKSRSIKSKRCWPQIGFRLFQTRKLAELTLLIRTLPTFLEEWFDAPELLLSVHFRPPSSLDSQHMFSVRPDIFEVFEILDFLLSSHLNSTRRVSIVHFMTIYASKPTSVTPILGFVKITPLPFRHPDNMSTVFVCRYW